MSGARLWLVSERLQTVKVSAVGGDCGEERSVVTTSAASYCTPISRMAVHFSAAQRALDPGDHVLVLRRVEVDPAEGLGGLLGGQGR